MTTKITINLFVHSIYVYIYIDLYICIYMLNIYYMICMHIYVVESNLIDKDWISSSVYLLNVKISVFLYNHLCSHSAETIVSYIRDDWLIYSEWSSSIKAHFRARWSDVIFVTLLRRRRLSHLVFVSVDYAQTSNDDRNNDRNNDLNNDLDSKSLHEDQARFEADHQMKKCISSATRYRVVSQIRFVL
jgi:hypothetical protein